MSSQNRPDYTADDDLLTEDVKPKVKQPRLYKVVILNDDYTPMEFVVEVLEMYFGMDREKATRIMLTIHTQGAATAGIFPRDIAETKAELVNSHARENDHPLLCEVEPGPEGEEGD